MQGLRVVALLAAICAAACSRHDTRLADHADAFASLSATTTAIVDNWLRGSVSGTYALTALDRTYVLVEQERTALTSSASLVIDARGAALADSAADLAHHIADLIAAVSRADAAGARHQLGELPFQKAT
jgi:hypothetical protein